MSQVTGELYSWKEELEAIAIGLVGTADQARVEGVHRAQLDELQDVIDKTNSVCMDLGAAIRNIESE